MKIPKGHCQQEHTQSLNFCLFWCAHIEVVAMNFILNLNILLWYQRNFKIHMFQAHLAPCLYLVYVSRNSLCAFGTIYGYTLFPQSRIHIALNLQFQNTFTLESPKLVYWRPLSLKSSFKIIFLEMGRIGIHMYPNMSKTG